MLDKMVVGKKFKIVDFDEYLKECGTSTEIRLVMSMLLLSEPVEIIGIEKDLFVTNVSVYNGTYSVALKPEELAKHFEEVV